MNAINAKRGAREAEVCRFTFITLFPPSLASRNNLLFDQPRPILAHHESLGGHGGAGLGGGAPLHRLHDAMHMFATRSRWHLPRDTLRAHLRGERLSTQVLVPSVPGG